jgi:hypothetical protein
VRPDPTTGRSRLDREWQAAYNLRVVARDLPRRGGPDQKSAAVTVRITLTDVNDSPPQFTQSRYSAVVPENSPTGTLIAQVIFYFFSYLLYLILETLITRSEPVFLNVYGAQESIPRNEFRKPL